MKRYIKSFLPDFRPIKGSDASFDIRDFGERGFDCPIVKGDIGVYVISSTDGTKYIYPNGKKSPIIYIGMSDDLLRRLKDEHCTTEISGTVLVILFKMPREQENDTKYLMEDVR